MIKMRDKISHGYFGVDYEIVWKVIKEKSSQIKTIFNQILEEIKKSTNILNSKKLK